MRPVTLGDWVDVDGANLWIVESGLKAGDAVIVDGIAKLHARRARSCSARRAAGAPARAGAPGAPARRRAAHAAAGAPAAPAKDAAAAPEAADA